MTESVFEPSWVDVVAIVFIWLVIFSVVDIVAPYLLSNVVVSGFAGGLSFVASLGFLRERATA